MLNKRKLVHAYKRNPINNKTSNGTYSCISIAVYFARNEEVRDIHLVLSEVKAVLLMVDFLLVQWAM